MDMLLDKIKSAAIVTLVSALLFAGSSAIAMKFVGRARGVSASRAFEFAIANPISVWPFEMTIYLLGAAFLTIAMAFLLWTTLSNFRWTYRPRNVDGGEAMFKMLARSTTQLPHIFAGKFAGKAFYASIEDRGLVIGPPGTGKTAFLFNQLLRATKSKLSFVAIDLKPELHKTLAKELERSGYRVLRINPAKASIDSDHWNPLEDIKDEIEIAELCTSLLPIRDAKEAPFIEAQRDWLKAAVFHISSIPNGSLPAAFNLLSSYSDPLQLLDVLCKSTNATAARLARRMTAGMTSGKDPLMLQGLSGALRGIDYLGLQGVQDALGYSDFSVRELGKNNQPTALFLQFEESKINALGPLLAFMATGVITTLIDTAGERQPVGLFLDELGNMPPIPNLPEKLNTIRSRHIPTWMYFQTAEQMNLRYGKGAEEIFFASADVQMVFRLNDQATRERISQLVGTTDKYKYSSNSTGQTRSKEKANVIEPHQLGDLKVSQIVMLYRGAAAKGIASPHYVDFPAFRRKTT
jgi:type IV secretory pathway TraG/TraD family ATPase VirD4